jgi:hypothetical protein
MQDQLPLFNSDYTAGSQTTGEEKRATVTDTRPAVLQTASGETSLLPPVEQLIRDVQRYGTGKPRREVIRGKISRD